MYTAVHVSAVLLVIMLFVCVCICPLCYIFRHLREMRERFLRSGACLELPSELTQTLGLSYRELPSREQLSQAQKEMAKGLKEYWLVTARQQMFSSFQDRHSVPNIIHFFHLVNFCAKNFAWNNFCSNVLILNVHSKNLRCIIIFMKTIFLRFFVGKTFFPQKRRITVSQRIVQHSL